MTLKETLSIQCTRCGKFIGGLSKHTCFVHRRLFGIGDNMKNSDWKMKTTEESLADVRKAIDLSRKRSIEKPKEVDHYILINGISYPVFSKEESE